MTRKLASIVELDDVIVHPNADNLELAVVGGWQCVVTKGQFKKGDVAIYCEIDSMLPIQNPMFSFLEARGGLKVVNDEQYSRIKTIKLRKEISQGLVVPIPTELMNKYTVGKDLTEKLGVIKFEKPEAGVTVATNGKPKGFIERLATKIRGHVPSEFQPWPWFIPKTDQERVQNMTRAFYDAKKNDELFEVTYKLDGSSFTAFYKADVGSGVCSRNYLMRSDDYVFSKEEVRRNYIADFLMFNRKFFKNWKIRFPEKKTRIVVGENNFVKLFHGLNIGEKLQALYTSYGIEVAIQGEMIGPGIQGNFEGNKELELYVFNVYNITDSQYLLPVEAKALIHSLGLNYVPVFDSAAKLPEGVKECVDMADGPAAFKTGKFREGQVWKSLTRDFSFKAISNSYLLKKGE